MWRFEVASLLWKRIKQFARSMIGVPDYNTYLQHCLEHHPDCTPMTYSEFFTERQSARYRGTGGRCC
jgi:uncharacterized short protein YbdD (DUF466 family)